MIKSSSDKIIAAGTDWRFIQEVRKEGLASVEVFGARGQSGPFFWAERVSGKPQRRDSCGVYRARHPRLSDEAEARSLMRAARRRWKSRGWAGSRRIGFGNAVASSALSRASSARAGLRK